MKKILFGILIGVILSGTIAYATIKIQASEIGYKDGNVEDALNNLYNKAKSKAFCMHTSGIKGTVGSKYACDPGDGVARNFYILKVDGNNVDLIMEKNLSDEVGENATMIYSDAIHFFDEENSGYATKQAWNKIVSIDLPSAQDIAVASEISNFDVTTATNWSFFGVNSMTDTSKRANYSWLYNYTKNCISNGNCTNECSNDNKCSYGYWTKELLVNSLTDAWSINANGSLDMDNRGTTRGVRPVIRVLKSNLSN